MVLRRLNLGRIGRVNKSVSYGSHPRSLLRLSDASHPRPPTHLQMWPDFIGTKSIGLSASEQTAGCFMDDPSHQRSMAGAVFAARSKIRHRVSASSDLAFRFRVL